jgi:large subunit ribosomal protein L23
MTERFQSRLADVIRRPLITEKATRALELNQYTFEVDHRAAKPDIKAAIEQLFDVKVTGISTMNPPRRSRRMGRFAGKRAQVKKGSGAPSGGQLDPTLPRVLRSLNRHGNP